MKTVAIYVDWPDRLAFYARLREPLARLGWSPVFLTNKIVLHRLAGRRGFRTRLLRRADSGELPDLGRTREVAGGFIGKRQAELLCGGVLEVLESLLREGGVDQLMIWNGSDVIGEAARLFARRHACPVVFLELGNLPGKLFADPMGVNARSSLTNGPELLDRRPADERRFETWRRAYVESKLASHTVPQASVFDRVSYTSTAFNHFAHRWLGVPTDDATPLWRRWRNRRRRRRGFPVQTIDDLPSGYVFYPMQVSTDTQLLINSDIGNMEAIEECAAEASRRNCELLVKPHPAEQDPAEIERVLELQRRLGFRFVSGNTFHLVEAAQLVVTVNSTVGLEALLLGRQARFLGRSFYPHLAQPERLASYVLDYLLQIDYFGGEAPSTAEVERLLGRGAVPTEAG